MNERYFLTPRNSIEKNVQEMGDKHKDGLKAMGSEVKDGLQAMGDRHKDGLQAMGDRHKDGLQLMGSEVKDGLQALGNGVFAISISIMILGLRRRSRNVGYVFVKTVNRNVSH